MTPSTDRQSAENRGALSKGLSIVASAALAFGLFCVVFLSPALVMGESVMLFWGWFGMPLGFFLAVIFYDLIVQPLEQIFDELLTPDEPQGEALNPSTSKQTKDACAAATVQASAMWRGGTTISATCPICRSRIVARQFDATDEKALMALECACKACSCVVSPERDS